MQTSGRWRPCPNCGRERDSDCRWNDKTILCHQGQSHGPPSHLKRGDTINIGGKQWTIKDISQAINCNHEHARRTLQSLMSEHQIARRKLPSTGGRPLYAYTELDFSYNPNTPPH